MLYLMLTLLPFWISAAELDFHIEFVRAAYTTYFHQLSTIGLSDSRSLSTLKKNTAYSLRIIMWYRPVMWLNYSFFYHQLRKLRILSPPDVISKTLKLPY